MQVILGVIFHFIGGFASGSFYMQIEKNKIEAHNQSLLASHKRRFDFAASEINNVNEILQKLIEFQVAIPSWALGTGGTRFGRFSGSGKEAVRIRSGRLHVGRRRLCRAARGALHNHDVRPRRRGRTYRIVAPL